jgi:hypothetical protein
LFARAYPITSSVRLASGGMVRITSAPTAKIPASRIPTTIGVTTGRRNTPASLMWPRCRGPEAKLPMAQVAASAKVNG